MPNSPVWLWIEAIAGSVRVFRPLNICHKPPSLAAVFCPPTQITRKY